MSSIERELTNLIEGFLMLSMVYVFVRTISHAWHSGKRALYR